MTQYSYLVRNTGKYAGDPSRVVARSKWELMYMNALDMSPMVRKWISEPKNLNIAYVSPLDKKIHQYWPDFVVQYIDGNVEILEIKPLKQSLAEKATNTYDKLMLLQNVAKWAAANNFAKKIGGRFRVITEQNLFRKKTTKQAKPSNPSVPSRRPQGPKK
jgi:hypothetical protein